MRVPPSCGPSSNQNKNSRDAPHQDVAAVPFFCFRCCHFTGSTHHKNNGKIAISKSKIVSSKDGQSISAPQSTAFVG